MEAGLSTVDSLIGTAPAPPLDIYEPVYGPRPPEPTLAPSGSDQWRFGVYLQDQLSIGTRLTLVPAVRLSRLRREDRSPAALAAPAGGVSTETPFTPSLGIVLRLRPALSLYASCAEGFEPAAPGQHLEDGRALEPVESRAFEAGVKAELVGRRLLVSVAGFGSRQTNVPEADTRGFYRQIGAGESRGVEAEVVGCPARGLVVRAGYAWTDADVVEDAAGFSGNALPNAPEHKAHGWLRGRLPGRLDHLSLAAGVVHVSERFSSRDNRVRVPPYTRFDATAFVELSARLELSLVAQNLANTRSVTSGGGAFFAGPPRRLAATLTARF
jgi:iron complex outermembrane receptor protein